MVALALTLLLAADPSVAPRVVELKIAAPGLVLTGMDAALSGPLTEQIAKSFAPIQVVTPRDIAALLGLERQKELLGCANGGECMAELGNALGVQGVMLGDIVKLGGTIQINARIIDPVAGRTLATASDRVTADSELFDALTRVGLQLRAQFYASQGVAAPTATVTAGEGQAPAPASHGTRKFSLIPLAISVVGFAAGVTCFVLSGATYQSLTHGSPHSVDAEMASSMVANGKTFETVGVIALGVGIAALLTAAAVFIFGSKGDPL